MATEPTALRRTGLTARTGANAAVLPLYAGLAGLALLLVLVAGLGGIGLGLSEDTDSPAILAVLEPILNLDYQRSRNYGVPLYEISSALIYGMGGLVAVNLASLAYTLLGLALLWRVLEPACGAAACLAFLAIALNPLTLVNASVLMETAQLFLAFSFTLLCACRLVERSRGSDLVGVAVGSALLVLIRPDAVLFVFALAAALMVEFRSRPALALRVFLGFALAGLAVLAAYVGLNGGLDFLDKVVLRYESWPRRVLRAVLSVVNFYGVIGSLVLALLGWRLLVAGWRAPNLMRWLLGWSFLDRLLALAVLFHLPRFMVLPDELEYILLPLCLSFVVLARHVRPWPWLLLVVASTVLNSIVHLAWFERPEDEDHLVLSPSLQPGALFQDWRNRRFNLAIETPEFQDFILRSALGEAGRGLELEVPLWFPGFVTSDRTAIIGRESLYRFDVPGHPSRRFMTASYKGFIVCDEPLFLQRGWRLMQPPTPNSALERFESGEVLHCAPLPGRDPG